MIGIGTIVNGVAVIAGGLLGLLFKKGLKERYQDIIVKSVGLAVIFIGISGALSKMLVPTNGTFETQGGLMVIATLVLGSLIGEWINVDGHTETFGTWLRKKAKSESDSKFIEGFVVTSLTICVGAMAVVGSLEDGLMGNPETLYMKAILDFIIVAVFAASYGKGTIFSVIPLVIFQGSITALAGWVANFFTEEAITNLSLVGSMLIFCVGVNLMFSARLKIANMLPSLVLVVIWSAIF